MSLNDYKWIAVLVALTVILGAIMSDPIYKTFGHAGGCVFGNFMTAVHGVCLLTVGNMAPTRTNFLLFVAVLYGGFPFTVISQLSTGPMLDAIAPVEKRGFVQGINNFAMNLASAISPWLLGMYADKTSNNSAIWTCAVVSLVACAVNAPLLMYKQFMPKPVKHKDMMALPGEEKDLIERALRGEWIPAEQLDIINTQRMNNGEVRTICFPLALAHASFFCSLKHVRALPCLPAISTNPLRKIFRRQGLGNSAKAQRQ